MLANPTPIVSFACSHAALAGELTCFLRTVSTVSTCPVAGPAWGRREGYKQMGAGIAAGPHCRRCWHSRFPAPELTASFRRSLPFGSRSCERSPPVRFAFQSPLQAEASLSAPPSVLRRPQFLTTWAWQSLVPLPHSPRCRVSCRCWRVSFSAPSGTAPSGSALARLAFGRTVPPVVEGPFRSSRRAAPCSVSADFATRSCDLGPCRIHFASGRRSGFRNRSFRSAIRPFQNAPQHVGTGFNAYFSVRPDQELSAL